MIAQAVVRIPLTRGLFAIIDAADEPLVSQFKWHAVRPGKNRDCYAMARINGRGVLMHRLILGTPKGFHTDHRNGRGLDNRRCNIRVATVSQNQCNRGKQRNGKRFKGVFHKGKKFEAIVGFNGRNHYLGLFDDEIEAARAYNAKAKELHGEFARLNEV